MSPTTPPPESREPDDLLPDEADLRGHYAKLSRPEPGSELDARVRRMAEQALDDAAHDNASPRTLPPRGRSRGGGATRGRRGSGHRHRRTWWLAAAGSVAVAVLAVGLVRHQRIGPPATQQAPMRAEEASEAAPRSANSAAGRALSAARMPPATLPRKSAKSEPTPPFARALPQAAPPAAAPEPTPQAPQKVPAAKPPPPAAALAAPPLPPSPAAVPRASSSPAARLSLRATPSSPLRAQPSRTVRDARAAAHGSQPAETRTLQHIRDLLAQGQTERALDLLKAFHKAYPDLPLPADLRGKLPEK